MDLDTPGYVDVVRRVLCQIREAQGISQRTLSKLTGYSESTLSRFASGERGPTLDIYLAVCVALKVGPAAVFAYVDLVFFGEDGAPWQYALPDNMGTNNVRHPTSMDPAKKEGIISDYLNNINVDVIAERHGVSATTVYSVAKRNGVKRDNRSRVGK